MNEFNRIAISGKICSGKTTVANLLIDEFDYERMFFANELKTLCADIVSLNNAWKVMHDIPDIPFPQVKKIEDDLHRICFDDAEYNKAVRQVELVREEFKDVTYYDPKVDKKTDLVRRMLQEVGTEYMRMNVNDNIWINALENTIKVSNSERIIVDDLRFPNEFKMLRENGFVLMRLQVSRETQMQRMKKLYGKVEESKLDHVSEVALDASNFDYIIDADQPLDEMLESVRKLIKG